MAAEVVLDSARLIYTAKTKQLTGELSDHQIGYPPNEIYVRSARTSKVERFHDRRAVKDSDGETVSYTWKSRSSLGLTLVLFND